MAALDITLIPALRDNYVYLLREPESGTVAVVDPAEAAPVIRELDKRGWSLDLILNTHHHNDHIGGNAELKAKYGATLIAAGADAARIPGIDRPIAEGDSVAVGRQMAKVIAVPGHTSEHIAFWFEGAQALFCGDALFALGCGRMFEGTAPQMWQSLLKLRALPDATRFYCGHEYTQSNAAFALSVDPDNPVLQAYVEDIEEIRESGAPTIPAQLGREKLTNPFLRADVPELQAALGMTGTDPAAVFGELRGRKDRF